MSKFPKTDRTKLKRIPDRGQYSRKAIYKIIDEALVCHVGFVIDDQPFIIPTLHARMSDELILHGAKASRMLRHVGAGQPVSVAITLLDALVLARSVFHHSVNYRSVVIFGKGRPIEEPGAKMEALRAVSAKIMPGRWSDARQPSDKELDATAVVAIPLQEASAKVRGGPPGDDPADLDLPVWAGVLPLKLQPGTPENAPNLPEGIVLPDYIRRCIRNWQPSS